MANFGIMCLKLAINFTIILKGSSMTEKPSQQLIITEETRAPEVEGIMHPEKLQSSGGNVSEPTKYSEGQGFEEIPTNIEEEGLLSSHELDRAPQLYEIPSPGVKIRVFRPHEHP